MKIQLEINNKTRSATDKLFLESVVRETLEKSGLDFSRQKNIAISVALVNPDEIKKINRTWRGHDSATDVLSFAEFSSAKKIKASKENKLFLGELILCYDIIVKAKGVINKSKRREMAYVVSHGVLHLLGFRHGRKMFAIQDAVSQKYSPC